MIGIFTSFNRTYLKYKLVDDNKYDKKDLCSKWDNS